MDGNSLDTRALACQVASWIRFAWNDTQSNEGAFVPPDEPAFVGVHDAWALQLRAMLVFRLAAQLTFLHHASPNSFIWSLSLRTPTGSLDSGIAYSTSVPIFFTRLGKASL